MRLSLPLRPATWLALALGLLAGVLLSPLTRSPAVLAAGGDRSGESILNSAPIDVNYHQGLKIQISTDAIYFLDWKAGKLLASVPSPRKTGTTTKILGPIVERDLIADFGIEPGRSPQFMMTTAQLGNYDNTGARLFVLETISRQMAVYAIQPQTTSAGSAPKFELLEKINFAGQSAAPAR